MGNVERITQKKWDLKKAAIGFVKNGRQRERGLEYVRAITLDYAETKSRLPRRSSCNLR